MKAFRPGALLLAMLLALAHVAQLQAQEAPPKPENAEKVAEEAGIAWLRLLDKSDLDTAWERVGSNLRESVSKDQFKARIQSVRDGVGPIMTRRLKDATYRTTVAGAQEGQYVVLIFNSRFKDEGKANEVLTMGYYNDEWRPVGYFVR